ncbi:hypothetical protein O181_109519 [Austropuccinia psidii MF-1]|uniref:Uncharacterized protein n=1 Tax=Austropuccinia psidii MF-1 TaxID=1389203 RepID=A0A9Q3JWQ2_9BASI|nr:hypothetical protein [Austropuccinia psidii MF-1]
MEEGHSVGRCTELVDNRNKKWVIRQAFNYLFLNWERVPNDGRFPPKYLVREFQREQEELKRKLAEKNKEEEKKKKEKLPSFYQWIIWVIRNHHAFQQEYKSLLETIQPKYTIKKKTSIPGGFIEGEEVEEEKFIIPTKYKLSKQEEVVKPPEPTQPKLTTPTKEKEIDKKALIKLPKVEVRRKPLIEEG